MRLDRLGLRGKLNLLLGLPLAAVLLVATPLLVTSIGTARSARTTATAANNAQLVGSLVLQLQRERLSAVGYLASSESDTVALLIQQQTVIDLTATTRAQLGPSAPDEILEALGRVGSLRDLRQNTLRRSVTVDSIVRTYHAVIESAIDALRLTTQTGTDAEGTGQLDALDALLRASEQSTLYALAIAATATAPQTGARLLASASEQFDLFTERFVERARADQSALVVMVDEGETAGQLEDLARRLDEVNSSGAGRDEFVAEALAVANAQASLRRMVPGRGDKRHRGHGGHPCLGCPARRVRRRHRHLAAVRSGHPARADREPIDRQPAAATDRGRLGDRGPGQRGTHPGCRYGGRRRAGAKTHDDQHLRES